MSRTWTFFGRLGSLIRGRGGAVGPSALEAGQPLAREWATYLSRKCELLATHEGEWVVIHGDQILGVRPSYEEALKLGYEVAGYVDFLAHEVRADEPVHAMPSRPI